MAAEPAGRSAGSARSTKVTRSESARGRGSGPTIRGWTPSCSATVTGATSSTRYRYWRLEAIVADLDLRRHPFHVAVENFAARLQHRVGGPDGERVHRRRGPHRGPAPLEPPRRDGHRPLPARPPPRHRRRARRVGADEGLPLLGIDNLPGAVPLETVRPCRSAACCCSGRRGRGCRRRRVRPARSLAVDRSVRIDPFDQRGAAAAIAMHAWVRQHVFAQPPRPTRGASGSFDLRPKGGRPIRPPPRA